jgi:hypothetical protein
VPGEHAGGIDVHGDRGNAVFGCLQKGIGEALEGGSVQVQARRGKAALDLSKRDLFDDPHIA